MRIIFGSILTTITIVIVAVFTIPFLVSTDWIRDEVVARVSDKTGRSLTIDGRASLSVFPDLSLTVAQVAFSNPGGGGTFVRMEQLDVGLKLLPLLSGAVEVDRLIMTRPVFNLEIDQNGRPNWRFNDPAPTPAGAAKSPATGQPVPPANPGGAMPVIDSVQLSGVKIVAGTVSYRDPSSSTFQEINDINANLELPSLANPMTLAGTLSWKSEQVSFSTELAEPQALSTGTPTAFSLQIDAPQLQLALGGQLSVRDGFALNGTVKVSTPSVKKMARWMEIQTPNVAGLGPFSLTAGLKADETGVALDNANLSLDNMTAEGGLLIGIGGKKPVIRATLAVSTIDFDDYIAGAGSKEGNGGVPAEKAPSPGAGPGAGGWSDQPIDISALRTFDADFRISAAGLSIGGVKAGQSALAVTLKDAILRIDLSELQLYDGRAAGRLTINGASKTPAVAAAFNFDNVAANPLLTALTNFSWIEGRAKITGSLASRGLSQRGLVSALNGEIKLQFSDGAVRGINVAQMVRNIQVGNITGLTAGEAQKTDFSTFSASFNITRGIAQTNDIKMLSPLIRVSGAGVADLPGRTLDFRINPKIVSSIEGQGGLGDIAGLEVPILITGPWSKPKIAPDIENLLRDPSRAIEAAKDIGKVLQKALGDDPEKTLKNAIRNPGDFLKQLSGGGSQGGGDTGASGAAAPGASPAPVPIDEDLFKRLLGQ